MIKRTRIRPISEKKAKSGRPYLKRSAIKRSTKRIRKVNPKRRKSEFARCYHSQERVRFVKGLPCVACLVSHHSENAHLETDGMGRKAHYTRIVPLCGDYLGDARMGCHRMYDERRDQFERWFGLIDLDAEASRVQKLWELQDQEHLG